LRILINANSTIASRATRATGKIVVNVICNGSHSVVKVGIDYFARLNHFPFSPQLLSPNPIFAYLRSKSTSQNELERIEYDRQSRKN
jgi:hypothetical protein